jgi:phasin family protein
MPAYSTYSSATSNVSPALRAGLDAQVNFFNQLTRKSIESALKLSELNMQFAQHMLQHSVQASRDMLACSSPLQMASVAASASGPFGEQLRAYQQQLMDVLSNVQSELNSSAEAIMPPTLRSTDQSAEAFRTRSYAGNGSGRHPS